MPDAGAESVDALPWRRTERRGRRGRARSGDTTWGGNFGFAPITGAGGVVVESRDAGTLADLERLGASGVLPQTERLSPDLIAAITTPGEFDPGPQAAVPPGPLNIPAVALDAYRRAQAVLVSEMPRCRTAGCSGRCWPDWER